MTPSTATMTSRERVTIALHHKQPDLVPIDFGGFVTTIEAEAYADLLQHLDIKAEIMTSARAHAAPEESILEMFGVDTRYLWPFPTRPWEEINRLSTITDAWGIEWHRPPGSHYFDPLKHPFADFTVADVRSVDYPDLWDSAYGNQLAQRARQLYERSDHFLIADGLSVGIFETAWLLRGLEQFLVDLLVDKEFAAALLELVLRQRKDFFSKFLDAVGPYVGMVMVSDDLAAQSGPILAPELYREMIKPMHRELNSFIKQRTDARLLHHSCGALRPFLDDLLDVGVEIINPVQVSAAGMDSADLKRDYGDRLVFWGGGCDTQQVLQFGSPADVRREVERRMEDFKPGGGFVFTQVHDIQPGTPPENVVAMFEAAREFRRYG